VTGRQVCGAPAPSLAEWPSKQQVAPIRDFDSRTVQELGWKRRWNVRPLAFAGVEEADSGASMEIAEAVPKTEEAVVGSVGVPRQQREQTLQVTLVQMALDIDQVVRIMLIGTLREGIKRRPYFSKPLGPKVHN